MKSHADDFKELIRSLSCEKVIVGGFDWYVCLYPWKEIQSEASTSYCVD